MSFVLIFLSIFIGRLGSSIFGYQLLNTDEFVIGAKAMRLTNGFPISEFDGATSGILNAIFLTWPKLFGMDVTYLSIRLSGIFALSLIIFFTYKIISKYLEKNLSIFLIFPLVLFFSLTKDPDFLHYTNELISILLIVFSFYYYFLAYEKNSPFYLIIASVSLGLVLFAKMQFFPVACVIITFINFKLLFLEKRYYETSLSSFAFLFPIIFFSTYYFFNNEFEDLFYNVIHFPLSDFLARNQITQEELLVGSNSIKNIIAGDKKNVFLDHLIFNSVFHLLYLYLLIFIFIFLKKFKNNLRIGAKTFLEFKVLMMTSVIITTLLVILITGSVHRHYLINLLPIIPIFICFFIKDLAVFKNFKSDKLLIIFLALFSVSMFLESKKFYIKNFVQKDIFDNKISFYSPEILKYFKLDKNTDKLIVWGWKPEIYLLSGLTPSNREATNLKQIDKRPGREYYRKRFISEFDKNNPSIVIDYTKNKAIFYNKEEFGVENFIGLKERLIRNYVKIDSANTNCPNYYLRKDKYENFTKSTINYYIVQNNKNKLSKLNDFNVDDKMCDTEIIFDNTSQFANELILKLENEKKISEIMVLAAAKNEDEIILNIEIFQNKILQKKIDLNLIKKPYWSKIKFEKKIKADQILFKTKNLKEKKYGIDEIKIF